MEIIDSVLGYLVWVYSMQETCVDGDYPWVVILAAAAFSILSTTNRIKCYTTVQFIFGCDVILRIKHNMYCGLLHQRNKAQINKDNNRKNTKVV